MVTFSRLLNEKKNFIFIGETGSGKSEIALNTAVMLNTVGSRAVHVFDLDQTKAMFRARDAENEMTEKGIIVHYMPQLLDTPVMVNGIIPHLVGISSSCVLDVGGNENAARMVGCLSDYLSGENTAAIYVINPFRPWSDSMEEIGRTLQSITNACHLEKLYFTANPNVGPETDADDVADGLAQLLSHFPVEELSGVFVKDDLVSEGVVFPGLEVIPLHPYLIYPWNNHYKEGEMKCQNL